MALLAACSGGGDPSSSATTTAPRRTTTTEAPDDRRLVAHALPRVGDLGAGWVELNREPGGPDDPTLPTAPQLGPDCGGRRSMAETGAAFALFERRRMGDLDEELVVYALLFDGDDAATAQSALYRSATFEGCVVSGFDPAVAVLGADVDTEDRPLPGLAAGVDGGGRVVRATASLGGQAVEGRVETTVLRSGRAVGLVLRYVALGAPEPFTTDGLVRALADRLAAVGGGSGSH